MTITITVAQLWPWLKWGSIALVIYLLIGLILGLLLAAAGGGVEKKDYADLAKFALYYGWIFIRRALGF